MAIQDQVEKPRQVASTLSNGFRSEALDSDTRPQMMQTKTTNTKVDWSYVAISLHGESIQRQQQI